MLPSLSFRAAPVLLAALCPALLSSCGGGGGSISATASHNPGYGPFDRNGNYVESWADKPARKHAWASPGASSPTLAGKPARVTQTATSAERPPLITRRKKPTTPLRPLPTLPPVARPQPRPVSPPAVQVSPQPTVPEPAARHVVVKGDTLYSLSRRYNSSVGAIQRANGISGTIIRIGQTLRIPR